jgi:hypothetical protein
VSGRLHRLAALSSSAEEVALRVVQHCQTLSHTRCDVLVVFDGDTSSGAKRATNEARAAQATQAAQAPRRTQEQVFAVMTN